MLKKYRGSCHRGVATFEAELDLAHGAHIRIVSARPATKRERKTYETGI